MGEGSRTRGDPYAAARRRMREALEARGIRDPRVLAAMEAVPRHLLVPEALSHSAYDPGAALPIGERQTISAPDIVAMMTEALELTGSEKVLEIGTGSGYQAAVLARLAERVVSVERIPALVARARKALDRLGVTNVVVHLGDGTRGWLAEAPYDAIVVTAGGPDVPPPLLEQLAAGGRLVGPFGDRSVQSLRRYRKDAEGELSEEDLGLCAFVPLVGEHGWAP